MATDNKKLPTLRELNMSPEKAFKNDQFKQLLNKEPKTQWVKTNAQANNSKYLPIDKTEFLLDMIFQEWKVEIISTTLIVNSLVTIVRVHYLDPVTGEWKFHDGIGAKDLQMNKGAVPTDITQMKPNAVMMAAPMSKSYAIKDATHHLGRLFGRDLNRKDVEEYKEIYTEPNHERERFKELVNNAANTDELELLSGDVTESWQQKLYEEKYRELQSKEALTPKTA